MGIMKCNRNNCNSILCKTHTDEGYICDECKEEFEEMAKGAADRMEGPNWHSRSGTSDLIDPQEGSVPDLDVRDMFKRFMASHKDEKEGLDPRNINWDLL